MTRFPDLPKPPDVAGVLKRIREQVQEVSEQGEAVLEELKRISRARRRLPPPLPTEKREDS